MIRVVYRWQVAPQDFNAFKETWRRTTHHIHESVSGARGSFMLRSVEDESEVTTIATWDSLASWQAFWGNNNPEQMKAMGGLAQRISVDAYEQIEDHSR